MSDEPECLNFQRRLDNVTMTISDDDVIAELGKLCKYMYPRWLPLKRCAKSDERRGDIDGRRRGVDVNDDHNNCDRPPGPVGSSSGSMTLTTEEPPQSPPTNDCRDRLNLPLKKKVDNSSEIHGQHRRERGIKHQIQHSYKARKQNLTLMREDNIYYNMYRCRHNLLLFYYMSPVNTLSSCYQMHKFKFV